MNPVRFLDETARGGCPPRQRRSSLRFQMNRSLVTEVEGLVERWIPKSRILHPWPNVRFAPELVAEIRDATNRGRVPGSERFRKEIETAVNRRLDPPQRGRPPKAQNDSDQGEVSQCSLI